MSVLKEKAAIGVEVRIIIDDFGSNATFSKEAEIQLKHAGIKIFRFNLLNQLFLAFTIIAITARLPLLIINMLLLAE